MKNLRTSKKAKVAAFILCVLCLTLALGCGGPLEWLNERNAGDGYDHYKDNVEDLILENYVMPPLDVLQSDPDPAAADRDQWTRDRLREIESWMDDDSNLFYTIRGAADGSWPPAKSWGTTGPDTPRPSPCRRWCGSMRPTTPSGSGTQPSKSWRRTTTR